MVQTCSKCSRINPAEASYCYYDGSVLGSHGVNGGPINTGSQPFHHFFVFPSGKTCRNFDQLAVACQQHWTEAAELLQQGLMENFLGGLGRADLALAARESAHYPDLDRGLDQFLRKLPSEVLEEPRLDVEVRDINLGVLYVGEDRNLDLHLINQGMRLLYGSVSRDERSPWLGLGDPPAAQKLFQFGSDLIMPIHVIGKHLRASSKPMEGRLVVESNGGTETITIRATVPIMPYPDGALAGAMSPRQVAEMAKAAPKEAAPHFEKGAVARWYKENGWTYPVQGPASSGLGAVQQFFEALGLTPPPKVEITDKAVALRGNVGAELRHTLEVKAKEKRPVYAHATSDQTWLEVRRTKLNGRTALIPLVVPAVPDVEAQSLNAKVTVIANGNQRFVVPVTLEVGGSFNFELPPSALLGGRGSVAEAPEILPSPPLRGRGAGSEEADLLPSPPLQGRGAGGEGDDDIPMADFVSSPEEIPLASLPVARVERAPAPVERAPAPSPVVVPSQPLAPKLIHALPSALLGMALLLIVIWDKVSPRSLKGDDHRFPGPMELADPEPRIGIQFNEKRRFGIVMLKEQDPRDPEKHKQLTRDEKGLTNNTCIKLDGYENLFGQEPGRWVRGKSLVYQKNLQRWTSTWEYPKEGVEVRQTVQIVPNQQTRLLDTCLVHYLIENNGTIPHKVGLRVLLDTYIGANDGVPFAIPGQPGLLETMKVFGQKEIPDYIQALEFPNLQQPGTIAHLGLKLQGITIQPGEPDEEPLEKMVICRWPGNSEKKWDWQYKPMNQMQPGDPDEKDSCVVLYWPVEVMAPDSKRAMAFTYGLGTISSLDSGNSKLSIAAGGSFRPNKPFTVTAYVKDPQVGQTVRLVPQPGLSLVAGQHEEQTVGMAADYSQVSWRVIASEAKEYILEVTSGLERETYKVKISNSIF